MGYLYVILASLMWSFVGIMVRTAAQMVDSSVITHSRFLFGAIFLGILLLIKGRRFRLTWRDRWIGAGVIGKSGNYIFENIALTLGLASGNVVVWPIQAIFLAAISVLLFKEKLNAKKALAVVLCIAGVVFISWKGVPLTQFQGKNLVPLGLFAIAAIGSGIHVVSQKKLIHKMDSLDMNFSVFLLASIVTALPLPFTITAPSHFSLLPVLSLIGLGIVTGASFYLYAEALKRIPFLIAVTISNSCVIFTLLWSWLFFHEAINFYMILGAVIMLAGLIIINAPDQTNPKMEVKTNETGTSNR